MHKLFVLMLFKGADQTARMRSWSAPLLFTNSPKTCVSCYPESDLIRIKNNNVVRLDSSRLGMGRISMALLTRGERITISVNN